MQWRSYEAAELRSARKRLMQQNAQALKAAALLSPDSGHHMSHTPDYVSGSRSQDSSAELSSLTPAQLMSPPSRLPSRRVTVTVPGTGRRQGLVPTGVILRRGTVPEKTTSQTPPGGIRYRGRIPGSLDPQSTVPAGIMRPGPDPRTLVLLAPLQGKWFTETSQGGGSWSSPP